MPEFITLQELCDRLKLSDRTVYDPCRQGRLPGAAKVGGRWLVDEDRLLHWLAEGGMAQGEGHTTEHGRKAE